MQLWQRNTRKRQEGIAIVINRKLDFGVEREPKKSAPGGQPMITSSIYITAGEAQVTNGNK